MPQAIDPVTQYHINQAADRLAEEFAGVFSQETIARYMAESTDLLGEARINVFVPVLANRFARERLRALAQAQGSLVKEQPEVLFVCVHNAGPQPDGRRPAQAPLGRPGPRPLRRNRARRARSTRPSSRQWRDRRRHERGVPEAADRRGRTRRRRRDHDGLRRRLPDLPGQEVRGLAARRPGGAGPRDRAPDPRRDRRARAEARSAELLPERASSAARRSRGAGRRGDRHVRARLRRLRRDHGRREDRRSSDMSASRSPSGS